MLFNLILLLPCTACLFGASWLLCMRKSNSRAQNILAVCFLLSSLFFYCTANYITGVSDYTIYRRLDILDCYTTPFIIPFMYLYFRSLTNEGQFTWKDYIWFLPSIVVGIGVSVLYMAMSEEQTAYYVTSVLMDKSSDLILDNPVYRLHHLLSIRLYTIIALIQIIGTVICTLFYLKRYHHRLREFHSTLDDKAVNLDYTILYWFLLVIPFALGVMLVQETYWGENPLFTSLYFAGCAITAFGICYHGSKRRYTVENLAHEIEQADLEAIRNHYDSANSEKDTDDEDMDEAQRTTRYSRYLGDFHELIDQEHIFLQSTLRADEVANRMHTNRTYLSRMLKEEFNCTFSDYINRKRIEYAQDLLRLNPGIKLADLAERSGFTNANSFGRTFKQVAGIPPKEWLKSEGM